MPSDVTIGLAWRPAPHTSVCALMVAPDFSATRVGEIDDTISPSFTSTPRFSSVFFVYERMSPLNIESSAGPASTSVIEACSCATLG